MRLLARLFRVVWGGDVEPALRPVLAFIGISAIERLGASAAELGFAFLFGAVAAGAAGYLGGHLSDHLGRRLLMLVGWGAQAVVAGLAPEDVRGAYMGAAGAPASASA